MKALSKINNGFPLKNPQVPDHQEDLCGNNSGVSVFVATRNLDFETLQAYRLNVLMVNDRNARLEHQVVVDILDVNDNAPLLQAWDGSVQENSASTLITTIRAVDKDASPQYRQFLLHPECQAYLALINIQSRL
ncbi:Protocadherin beta-4 [Portunus trituberculatus]|uniref:Protocadherin beta-4 n=1 Tax=Portunus trituberculatus TaxID=210409 RepID=A0A5B7EZ35_PORTR|nr:Protocadherin beta-4 [Portunus trituberculatus]